MGCIRSTKYFRGAYGYDDIKNTYLSNKGYERFLDEEAKAPYLWSRDSAVFISYEDPESLKYKGSYIRDNALGRGYVLGTQA